jgi:hypothetical protein
MWFSSLSRWLKGIRTSTPGGRPVPRPGRRPKRPFRPGLEVLEGREVPATFTVTNLNDAGSGSLRQAIALANQNPADGDTIVFQPGLRGTITLTTGQLTVTGPVAIIGPGSGLLAIDGNHQSRIFELDNGSTSLSNYDLSGLTLTHGQVNAGIQHGGAIEVASETLILRDVVLADNSASGLGGGLFLGSNSFLLMDDCTVNHNTSAGSGGGLFLSDSSAVFIRTSTISDNRAVGGSTGGGIFYGGGTGLAIENCTIANNQASDSQGGGGIRIFGRGPVRIVNSTIAFNVASFSGVGDGGGISVHDFAGPVTLVSTIVADNLKGPMGFDPDIFVTPNSDVFADHCLVGDTDGSLVVHFSNSLVNVDPRLGPLQKNGGPTQTIALLPGSPAIDAGINPGAVTTDQRGPGFVRTVGPGTDIGAFEVQSVSSPAPQPGPVPVVEIRVTRVRRRTLVEVRVDGVLKHRFFPFGAFTGRVQVVKADVNGDGLLDVVASATVNGRRQTRTFVT